ncbi:hypothetical protein GCM10011415_21760 [Salipiger pallidus]|uniref:Uncharacterized protein n=1 Tax=Salipiger pallidus TaxID=1775170 RepID=A0A8J3EGR1_9RHOB|nr:hypothetical protein [Salipiger pallidus]GGG73165.1 hypothetical protein GCM10011415_21760 [Salipiger pallidus]
MTRKIAPRILSHLRAAPVGLRRSALRCVASMSVSGADAKAALWTEPTSRQFRDIAECL